MKKNYLAKLSTIQTSSCVKPNGPITDFYNICLNEKTFNDYVETSSQFTLFCPIFQNFEKAENTFLINLIKLLDMKRTSENEVILAIHNLDADTLAVLEKAIQKRKCPINFTIYIHSIFQQATFKTDRLNSLKKTFNKYKTLIQRDRELLLPTLLLGFNNPNCPLNKLPAELLGAILYQVGLINDANLQEIKKLNPKISHHHGTLKIAAENMDKKIHKLAPKSIFNHTQQTSRNTIKDKIVSILGMKH